MADKKVITLEQYSFGAKYLIVESQHLADHMRHTQIKLVHLCTIIRSVIETDPIFVKIGNNRPLISPALIEEFNKITSVKAELKKLNTMQIASEPNAAFLSTELLNLMKFAEANNPKIINVYALMHELFTVMKS